MVLELTCQSLLILQLPHRSALHGYPVRAADQAIQDRVRRGRSTAAQAFMPMLDLVLAGNYSSLTTATQIDHLKQVITVYCGQGRSAEIIQDQQVRQF